MFAIAKAANNEFENRKTAIREEWERLRESRERMDLSLGVTTLNPGATLNLPNIERDIRDLVPGATIRPDIDRDIRELVPGATVH